MKIAIIGIRGVPVPYSTFETFSEQLGLYLVKKNNLVQIYCRNKYVNGSKNYKGIERIFLPSIETKHFSTLSHSLLSTIHACLRPESDLILYCGMGSTIFSVIPRFFGIKTVVHIDGMDWKRDKWGKVARLFLRFSLFLTSIFPNAVVTDNKFMIDFYRNEFKKEIKFISYGYSPPLTSAPTTTILKKDKLKRGKYFVTVGRFVEENHLEEFIQAVSSLQTDYKGLIIGDDIFNTNYRKSLYSLIDNSDRLVRTGFIEHSLLLYLVKNSFAYVETKRNGGTQMSLIEAMGTGSLIISNNNPAHKHVLGTNALYYTPIKGKGDLPKVLKKALDMKKTQVKHLKEMGRRRAQSDFNWTKIGKSYIALFLELLRN